MEPPLDDCDLDDFEDDEADDETPEEAHMVHTLFCLCITGNHTFRSTTKHQAFTRFMKPFKDDFGHRYAYTRRQAEAALAALVAADRAEVVGNIISPPLIVRELLSQD
jgi:hypothetical protein